jgi:two-component system NtrC family sensor kinase
MAPLRFGLRAQIMVALSVVFLVSFALLGTAAVRLTQAASEVERARSARLYAGAFAAALERTPVSDRAAIDAQLDALTAHVELRALRIVAPGGVRYERGRPDGHSGVTVPIGQGGRLTLWLGDSAARARLPLGNLLLFYVSITGLAVLVLAYFALTHLIVRPLDRLTRSSELLAAGAADVGVPERGAAEVARLAAAFNAMAAQLRAERDALERRLRELEQTTTELRTTQQQLIHGEKLASVGRLAAGVAHEIGNPLAAILGFVELLRAGDLPAAQSQEFLARIHSETERIHRIIRDLLDFSRRDLGEPAAASADLEQVVADAVNLVRPQKASKQVEIRVELEPGIGRVLGPQDRLTQVVLNLLLNAIDALEGRGCVRIEAQRSNGATCVLSVTDDGPGLPAQILEHLFEPFTTTKPAGKGTGLGLAVCHTLVEGMGGQITARNLPEGGARFEVQLRCSPAHDSAAAAHGASARG